MSETNQITPEMELEALKDRATLLGVKFHPSISAAKLREKIAEHQADDSGDEKVVDETPEVTTKGENKPAKVETEREKRIRLKAEAEKLVRIRLTCMNQAKKEWPGEIFTASNRVTSMKKFVPFNADEGWHVPQIILEQILARQFQTFVTVKSKNGVAQRKGKMVKEFAVELLDPLTPEELHDLAQRQAMAKSVD